MLFDFSKPVEDLNQVPEQFRPVFNPQPVDGKFIVADPYKPLVEHYVGTTQALNKATSDIKKLNDENARRRHTTKSLEDYASSIGLTIENEDVGTAIKTYVEDLNGKVKGGQELKINVEKIQAEANKRVAEASAASKGELDAMGNTLSKHLIGDVATRAIAEEKGVSDLLMPHIRAQVKVVKDGDDYVVRVTDAQGDFRQNGAGGWMSVADLVKEMKRNTVYARAFDSEAPNGNGARPGTSKDTRNSPAANANNRDRSKMTPNELIARGLAKGQATRG